VPLFIKVVSSNRDIKRRTVHLTLASDDQKRYEFDLTLDQIPTVIFALSNEMGRILSTLPVGEHPVTQPIKGSSIITAVSASGGGALILRLEGGGELTIELSKDAIAAAAAALTELAAAVQRDRYH
jgi:hypothetical protein